MNIKVISEKMLLRDRKDVLRLHLYSKLLNIGVIPYEKDLDVLVALYTCGGYRNDREQHEFFDHCLEQSFKKSVQSVRNTLAKYTELGVLNKPKNTVRYLSEKWLPNIDGDRIVLDYKISHN